ncbi:MAG: hypothetical protein Tsb002_31580 [Wenzhouxiangellaceae bacterium]
MRSIIIRPQYLMIYLNALLILASSTVHAGANDCISINNGAWEDSTIWDCGRVPIATDNVTINGGFTVALESNPNIASLTLTGDSVLSVLNDINGFTLTLLDNTTSDLSAGSIDLTSDLTLSNTGGGSIILGPIDGNMNMIVSATGNVTINGIIGGANPPFSFTSMAPTLLAANITTALAIGFEQDVTLGANVILDAPGVAFNNSIDADLASNLRNLTINGDAFIGDGDPTDAVGMSQPLNGLIISETATLDMPAPIDIQTIETQDYQGDLLLNADTALSSAEAGEITLRNVSGQTHHLELLSQGVTTFAPAAGSNDSLVDVARITTDAGGITSFRNRAALRLNSSIASVFNDTNRFGPSADNTITQDGDGAIIFNGPIVRFSGSPHRLAINDSNGQTIFNNTVELGQLTTNDGPGNDQTVINTTALSTASGGANNGVMTMNDPVMITIDTVISALNSGRIVFNNTVDIGSQNVILSASSTGSIANAAISGSGNLLKAGSGDFTLAGDNTYSGSTIIENGRLLIDGSTAAASPVTANGGTLGGHGLAAGPVVINNAALAPGASPGRLDTGDLLLESDALFGVEIDGLTPATEYDQIFTTGTVTLNSPQLELSGAYLPAGNGDTFTLIDNDSTDLVSGTFAGLPEGSMVFLNGDLQISYIGGDGNDVVLADNTTLFFDGFEAL